MGVEGTKHKGYWRVALWVACGLTVVADLLYHKHGHFGWEQVWGFHGWYAIAAAVLLVLTAGLLRRVVTRGEDYYDD